MVEPPSWVVRRRDRSSPFFGLAECLRLREEEERVRGETG